MYNMNTDNEEECVMIDPTVELLNSIEDHDVAHVHQPCELQEDLQCSSGELKQLDDLLHDSSSNDTSLVSNIASLDSNDIAA